MRCSGLRVHENRYPRPALIAHLEARNAQCPCGVTRASVALTCSLVASASAGVSGWSPRLRSRGGPARRVSVVTPAQRRAPGRHLVGGGTAWEGDHGPP